MIETFIQSRTATCVHKDTWKRIDIRCCVIFESSLIHNEVLHIHHSLSQAHLAPALTALHPYITAGSVRAIFLGDEMMLAGISAANITAAADFVRAALGPGMAVLCLCGSVKHSFTL